MTKPRLTFFGAAGVVTGSATLVVTDQARILVDFGLFQGGYGKGPVNELPAGLEPQNLDAVIVTHGHLDHVGRLPLLVQHGFAGQIHCTQATGEIASLILEDSAKIQAQDLERQNRKRQRAGQEPLEPLYTQADVETVMRHFRNTPYRTPVSIASGIQATFVEAGHLLGSASVELQIAGGSRPFRLIFSGDIGPEGALMMQRAEGFAKADAVVLESTYGDRDHKPLGPTIEEFESIVGEVVAEKGKLLVPTFAVGRTQLLLFLLASMFRKGAVPKFPIFLDSPMAIHATEIYRRHIDLFNREFRDFVGNGAMDDDLKSLTMTVSVDESRKLNALKGPCMILAGSGMCTGGRILHHLKENLWKRGTAVLFVGYQAQGSLGRLLVEGREEVRIFGEPIAVRAGIHTLGGFSAHAGQKDLLDWLEPMLEDHPQVILNHGESRGRDALARLLKSRYGVRANLPELGDTVDFSKG